MSDFLHESGYVLAIASGNAHVTCAVYGGSHFFGKWRMEARPGRTADEYGTWLFDLLEHSDIAPEGVAGAIISCVQPVMEEALVDMCRLYFDVEPLLVGPGLKTGVQINHGRAGDLGPNRVANLVAATTLGELPAVVADFGTVTVLDAIDSRKIYRGGLVMPGLRASAESINQRAPQFPLVGPGRTEEVVGRNVQHSVRSGCYWGTAEAVRGLVSRIWREMGVEDGTVVATGGFAPLIAEGCDIFNVVNTNLTLEGLHLLYERNRELLQPRPSACPLPRAG